MLSPICSATETFRSSETLASRESGCLLLGFLERPGLVEKIFTVFGPLRDLEAHPGNELSGHATPAPSAGYGVVIRPNAQGSGPVFCFTFSAPELNNGMGSPQTLLSATDLILLRRVFVRSSPSPGLSVKVSHRSLDWVDLCG